MLRKKSKSVIEFNLLEKAINKKITDIINEDVLEVIDTLIETLQSETETEFTELKELFEINYCTDMPAPDSPYYENINKRNLMVRLNNNIEKYQLFAIKTETLNYLKNIRATIYNNLKKRNLKYKDN